MRILTFAAVLTSSSAAFALSSYQADIPNGDATDGFRCLTCHSRSTGGEGWNDFGQDILIAGDANPEANPTDQDLGFTGRPADYWAVVCGFDSDGDGSTNGDELGDPDCVWAAGDPDPDVVPSNPGDADSVPEDPGPVGEGEGEGETGGCASTDGSSPLGAVGLLAGLALFVRRRRR